MRQVKSCLLQCEGSKKPSFKKSFWFIFHKSISSIKEFKGPGPVCTQREHLHPDRLTLDHPIIIPITIPIIISHYLLPNVGIYKSIIQKFFFFV